MRLVVALLLTLACTQSYAQDELSGFATLSLSYSDNPELARKLELITGDTSPTSRWDSKTNSLIGIQWQRSLNEQWQTTLQFILRDQQEQTLNTLTQLAFIEYQPTANWSIRLGRTALDIFMMTKYRNIGYAYTRVQPPVELYAFIPHQHLDGADISYTTTLGKGTLQANGFIGRSKAKINDPMLDWNIELNNIYGATLEFNVSHWLFRANYSRTKLGNAPDSLLRLQHAIAQVPTQLWQNANQIADDLIIANQTFRYQNLSFKYDNGTYFAQGELSHIDSPAVALSHFKNEYFKVGARINLHTLQAGVARSSASKHAITPPNTISNNQVNTLYNHAFSFFNDLAENQISYSTTWRYDLTANTALKLQWDRAHLKDPISNAQTQVQKRWVNQFSTSVNWVF